MNNSEQQFSSLFVLVTILLKDIGKTPGVFRVDIYYFVNSKNLFVNKREKILNIIRNEIR